MAVSRLQPTVEALGFLPLTRFSIGGRTKGFEPFCPQAAQRVLADIPLAFRHVGGCTRHQLSGGRDDATEAAGVTSYGIGSGVASGDINNDGFLDLYVMNRTYYSSDYTNTPVNIIQQNYLYINNGNDNNWVKVKLTGTESNRDGLNAHVTVVSGNLTQLREVTSTHGYNSQDDLAVEFGLGLNTSIDSITVEWPSGIVQTVTDNISINSTITITEED